MNLQFVSLLVVLALFTAPAFGKAEFLKVEDPSIPEGVREASKSVFKMISQGGAPEEILNMQSPPEIIEQVRTKLIPAEMWWKREQLDHCRNSDVRYCLFFSQMGEGTGFVMNDPSLVYTTLHQFADVIFGQKLVQDIKNNPRFEAAMTEFPLFMGMTDQNQQSVMTIRNNLAVVNVFNPEISLFDGTMEPLKTSIGRLSDSIELRLKKPLTVTPLKQAVRRPKTGETVYLIGYPSETESSDGRSMYVSAGHVMDTKSWAKKRGVQLNDRIEAAYDQHMIFADFISTRGNGGGPIVNAQGEVIGIYSSIGGGLRTFDPEMLADLWDSLRE